MANASEVRSLRRLWYLGIAVFAVTVIAVPIIMSSCSQDSEVEEQQFAQMSEQLKATRQGDMLEFPGNQFAFVKKVEDDVILLRYVNSPSSRVFISTLAAQVIEIHRVGDPDRCSTLERLAMSIYY